ncbi:uncharacterized protein LOC121416719 [Lytechinus variegatus]|uniref:uncharacterized protein LOC121416719 n=1 Tax=Lytechinus variegatus TaxID=7654 RepID=UPI001BB18EE7|nr:uncharacterized protein LOC121416719 [Lytechinus variegatus]
MKRELGKLRLVQPENVRHPVQRTRVNQPRMLEVLNVLLHLLLLTTFFVALGQEIDFRLGVAPTHLQAVGVGMQVAPDPPITVLPVVNKGIGGEVAQVAGTKVHPSEMANRVKGSLDHNQTEQALITNEPQQGDVTAQSNRNILNTPGPSTAGPQLIHTETESRWGCGETVTSSNVSATSTGYSGYEEDFYLRNYYEYEQGNSEPLVKGRLKASVKFWKSIDAPQFVIDVIEQGYKLPFLHTPPKTTKLR